MTDDYLFFPPIHRQVFQTVTNSWRSLGEEKFYDNIPAPSNLPDYIVFIADTGEKRDLTQGGVWGNYNTKVHDCKIAARQLCDFLSRTFDYKMGLSQISATEYSALRALVRPDLRLVADHVFASASIVNLGIEAWRKGDLKMSGLLIDASGKSLDQYFGVSTTRLNSLTEIMRVNGVYGVRQVGAGLGGCIVGIAKPDAVGELEKALETYKSRNSQFAEHAKLYICHSTDGMQVRRPAA